MTIFINNTKYKGYIRKLTNIHKIFVTLLSAPDYRMMKVTPYYDTAIFVYNCLLWSMPIGFGFTMPTCVTNIKTHP